MNYGMGKSMGRFEDESLSQRGWIYEIAKKEIHPDISESFQLGRGVDLQPLVEESTLYFLSQLRECFSEHARIFNAYSENGLKFHEIKIYSVAQTPADFMLFRNQVKLLFSNPTHGVIQISFFQHNRNKITIDGQESILDPPTLSSQPQELLAQMGPFRDVFWTFQGEKVIAEQIAKFYFIEFSKASRDNQKSKVVNQVLLDQIKALLQEKGLDL